MGKGRSPNYPKLNLKNALEKGRMVYDKEHRHPATRAVVAMDMGYQSLNGASLSVLGALKRYNIMENKEDGWAISEDAVALFELPEGESEWNSALLRCAFAPPLFSEMRDAFPGKLPGDNNLRHWLVNKKFLPNAATGIIRIYQENMELVKPALLDYDGIGQTPKTNEDNAVNQPSTRAEHTQVADSLPASGGMKSDVFTLEEGAVTLQWPGKLSPEGVKDLESWLQLFIRKVKRVSAKIEAS